MQKLKPIVILDNDDSNIRYLTTFQSAWDFFHKNVAELGFIRRNEPPDRDIGHKKNARRMLATANLGIVKQAKTIFDWKPPNGNGPKRGFIWCKEHNLMLVWDLMLLKWRMINLNDYIIYSYTPAYKVQDRNNFIKFYKAEIAKWGKTRKLSFGDKVY